MISKLNKLYRNIIMEESIQNENYKANRALYQSFNYKTQLFTIFKNSNNESRKFLEQLINQSQNIIKNSINKPIDLVYKRYIYPNVIIKQITGEMIKGQFKDKTVKYSSNPYLKQVPVNIQKQKKVNSINDKIEFYLDICYPLVKSVENKIWQKYKIAAQNNEKQKLQFKQKKEKTLNNPKAKQLFDNYIKIDWNFKKGASTYLNEEIEDFLSELSEEDIQLLIDYMNFYWLDMKLGIEHEHADGSTYFNEASDFWTVKNNLNYTIQNLQRYLKEI